MVRRYRRLARVDPPWAPRRRAERGSLTSAEVLMTRSAVASPRKVRWPARRLVALIAVVLAASLAQVTLPVDASARIAPLDCSGTTIYQLQRDSTGSTSGRLNTVAVGSMSGTN